MALATDTYDYENFDERVDLEYGSAAAYSEARSWAVWLRVFTVEDMAASMAVTPESLVGYLVGLERNGSIVRAGELDDLGGIIYEWIPLPEGPRVHPIGTTPEQLARAFGAYEEAPVRGYPIRIRTERAQRKNMSTPGARGKIVRREQRYQRMQEAVRARREKQRIKARQQLEAGGF